MAIIGKIREKSGLLVGIVGLALLAFVLGDYQSMFGRSEGKYGIGLVYGKKVNIENYSNLSFRVQEQDRSQAAQAPLWQSLRLANHLHTLQQNHVLA